MDFLGEVFFFVVFVFVFVLFFVLFSGLEHVLWKHRLN